MAGRGGQTHQKRQKEQQRKERMEEKAAKRLERKKLGGLTALEEDAASESGAPLPPESVGANPGDALA